MGRRQINLQKAKSRQKTQSLKRIENVLLQRLLIIIACEGAKTERYYFESWFQILKEAQALSPISCVFAPHQHTNPTGVLADLISFRDTYGRTYKDYEHRWIIIDRDEERCGGGGHTLQDFNEAILKASANRPEISVAWSNPSFELWYLIHFCYHNTPIDRDQVNIKLSRAISGTYEKNDRTMYSRLKLKLRDALRNAKRLHDEAKESGALPAATNPGTTVYELVNLFLELLNPPQQVENPQPSDVGTTPA
ncbi:MAG TPA: RloB family protein [Geobacteraceae bacterium]